MPHTQTRVVGSGFTTFNYRGKPIAFLERIQDSGQTPIARPEAVHPLGSRHPIEIATPRALNAGSLTLTIRELWSGPVWQQLAGLAGTDDIIAIYERIAAEASSVTCQMIIRSPQGRVRGKTYHGCVVTEIDTSETVEIASLTIPRSMTVWYTHTTPIRG